MAKKRGPEAPENHERWLVSYADFITLLFAFFVVMFASSQTDKARAKQVSQAVEKALEEGHSVGVPAAVAKILGGTVDDKGQGNAMMKGPGGAQHATKETPPQNVVELLPALQRLNSELENEIKAGKIEMHLEPRGLVISLRQSAFFPSGGDQLDDSSLTTMGKLAALIGTIPNPIQLEGHTDSVPIHNARFKSNWELSCARGIAVLEALCGNFGLSRQRFSVVGRADTLPIDSNDTPQGRARNRRVDVVIVNSLKIQNAEAIKAAVRK
ncbi:MAG TPA: flagellar motor protein MotB [Candidatus Acidoferrales bacterium]|nr:flagellar motor protein MotB [Candidatus Acidoferrales bacterium]